MEWPCPKAFVPRRFEDERGHFSEVYRKDLFDRDISAVDFVQDNESLSRKVGTVRGLHFQLAPHEQGKLVRALTGAIFDVAVDIRPASPFFGQAFSEILSADNGKQFWIPPGFAHGFCTLEPDTRIHYKVTASYSPAHDRGLAWDDPALAIDWPLARDSAVLSDKDRRWPRLADLGSPHSALKPEDV